MEKLIDSAVRFARRFSLLQLSFNPNRFLLQFSVNTLRNPDGFLGAQHENRLQLGLVWGGIRLLISKGRFLKQLHNWLFSWRILVSWEQGTSTIHQWVFPASRTSHSLGQLHFCFNVGTKFHPHIDWGPFPLVVLISNNSCFLGVWGKKIKFIHEFSVYRLEVCLSEQIPDVCRISP